MEKLISEAITKAYQEGWESGVKAGINLVIESSKTLLEHKIKAGKND